MIWFRNKIEEVLLGIIIIIIIIIIIFVHLRLFFLIEFFFLKLLVYDKIFSFKLALFIINPILVVRFTLINEGKSFLIDNNDDHYDIYYESNNNNCQ